MNIRGIHNEPLPPFRYYRPSPPQILRPLPAFRNNLSRL